jgi:hypothetical protein
MVPKEFTIRLPWGIANEFMHAMVKLVSKKEFKTENENKMQGILEATRYHLEDLRQMLNLSGAHKKDQK